MTAKRGNELKQFIVTGDDGYIKARDNLCIVFFKKMPFVEIVEQVAEIFDKWMNMIPEDSIKWSLTSYSQAGYKPFKKATLTRCLKLLTKESARNKTICIELAGPQPYGSDYLINILGVHESPSEDHANIIEMRFPINFMKTYGIEKFIQFSVACFQNLEGDSGLASFSYARGSDVDRVESCIGPLALRYPGFDLASDPSMRLGKKCRGARWLTMLSNELIEKSGGKEKIKALEKVGVEILEVKHGLVLRAGEYPEIGDVNKNIKVPLLTAVAKAIEPITYFNDIHLTCYFGDREKRDRWERRFWTDEE